MAKWILKSNFSLNGNLIKIRPPNNRFHYLLLVVLERPTFHWPVDWMAWDD